MRRGDDLKLNPNTRVLRICNDSAAKILVSVAKTEERRRDGRPTQRVPEGRLSSR